MKEQGRQYPLLVSVYSAHTHTHHTPDTILGSVTVNDKLPFNKALLVPPDSISC